MRNNIYWLSPGCAGFKYAVCPALDGRFFWVRYAEEFLEAEMEEVWRDAELCPVVVVNFGERWRARERGATRTMSFRISDTRRISYVRRCMHTQRGILESHIF